MAPPSCVRNGGGSLGPAVQRGDALLSDPAVHPQGRPREADRPLRQPHRRQLVDQSDWPSCRNGYYRDIDHLRGCLDAIDDAGLTHQCQTHAAAARLIIK